jgi:hypothetical protein
MEKEQTGDVRKLPGDPQDIAAERAFQYVVVE